MRLLKIITTLFAIGSIGMLIGWPWAVGAQPEGEKAKLEWLLRASQYFIGLLVVLFATTVFAWLVVRRQREEYQRDKLDNLKDLIEGSLRDHGRDP